jgi:uncharacterized SAM-binding protein YcdF (DUF218 family)
MSFILSKVLWVVVTPGNLLVLLVLLGTAGTYSNTPRMRKLGRRASFTATCILIVIAFLPVDQWVMAPLENIFPPVLPDKVDGILLLGGDEDPRRSELRGQPTALHSMQRYLAFVELSQRYPAAKLVYVGGSGHLIQDSSMTEADVAREALAIMGIPPSRMVFETQSRNTHENAVFTARMLKPDPQHQWLLVTNAFHMPRAVGCFRKAGWNIAPYAAGYLSDGDLGLAPKFNLAYNLFGFSLAVHEYVGLIAYRFMGYTDAVWPQ